MKVGYNKGFAALLLVLGLINLGLAMHPAVRGTTGIIGAIVSAMGLAFMLGHQLEVDGGVIKIKNPWGMTLKTYTYTSPAQLRFDGKKMFVDSQRVKGAGGMMVDGGDWSKLQQWVQNQSLITRHDD